MITEKVRRGANLVGAAYVPLRLSFPQLELLLLSSLTVVTEKRTPIKSIQE